MGHTCYSLYPKYYGESKLIDSQIDDFVNAEYDFRAPVVWNLQNYFCSIMMRGDRFAIFCIPDTAEKALRSKDREIKITDAGNSRYD